MKAIIDELPEKLDRVITEVSGQIPRDFPDEVATPIFDGMLEARKRLKRTL